MTHPPYHAFSEILEARQPKDGEAQVLSVFSLCHGSASRAATARSMAFIFFSLRKLCESFANAVHAVEMRRKESYEAKMRAVLDTPSLSAHLLVGSCHQLPQHWTACELRDPVTSDAFSTLLCGPERWILGHKEFGSTWLALTTGLSHIKAMQGITASWGPLTATWPRFHAGCVCFLSAQKESFLCEL